MLQRKCGSAFFKDRGNIDCGCGWGEMCSSNPILITHIVQAHCTGTGWMDCKTAISEQHANILEQKLLKNDSAWMSGDYERKTRVVPIDQSNCKDKYNL